jgi:NAD(P)H dehydrogenase (quinone)
MYAITGITGNVGGEVARSLLAAGHPVRAVVRNPEKGSVWEQRGCQVAVADINDVDALVAAFQGADGVFVMVPPNFDPAPDFPEAHATAAILRPALERARPSRVVYLSTIGAQSSRPNLLTQHTILERELRQLSIPITFLRPGWFMENSAWDVAPAREHGVIPSFLQSLDRAVPMVATSDIGQVAAELLLEQWSGARVVELEGPDRVTPNEIAITFAKILGRPVRMEAVPSASWESLFRSQGMKHPMPRIQMLDGFNQGWIGFEGGEASIRKGSTPLKTVLQGLVDRG